MTAYTLTKAVSPQGIPLYELRVNTTQPLGGSSGLVAVGDAGCTLYAAIGFDERPVIHCIIKSIKEGLKPVKLRAYTPRQTSFGAEKNRVVMENLEYLLKPMGVKLVQGELDAENLRESIRRAYGDMKSDVGEGEVVLCLSGGMRILVLAIYTAALLLDWEEQCRVRLYIEPEGQPERGRMYRLAELTAPLNLIRAARSPLERSVVEALIDTWASGGETTLAEVVEAVRRATGSQPQRSSVYRVLQRLVSEGLLDFDRGKATYRVRSC